jgi:hypothetical protein
LIPIIDVTLSLFQNEVEIDHGDFEKERKDFELSKKYERKDTLNRK